MKKIAIFAKVHDPRCQGVAEELIRWLEARDLIPLVEAHLAHHLPGPDVAVVAVGAEKRGEARRHELPD